MCQIITLATRKRDRKATRNRHGVHERMDVVAGYGRDDTKTKAIKSYTGPEIVESNDSQSPEDTRQHKEELHFHRSIN